METKEDIKIREILEKEEVLQKRKKKPEPQFEFLTQFLKLLYLIKTQTSHHDCHQVPSPSARSLNPGIVCLLQ